MRCLAGLLLLVCVIAQEDPDYFYDESGGDEDRNTSSDWLRKLETDVLPKGLDPPINEDDDGAILDVQLLFSSFDHVSLDEKQEMLRVHGRLCLVWNDQRMLWNPAEYNGVSDLHVSSDDVWTPKFKVVYSNRYTRDHWETQPETVHIFVTRQRVNVVTCPRFHVRTACPLDMSHFPNDEHKCSFMLSSADHLGNINLINHYSVNDHQSRMHYLLSRNETRPTVGDFTITKINSTTMYSDGLDLHEKPLKYSFTVPIAVQWVYLKRHAVTFFSTYTVPSIMFSVFNMSAAISVRIGHSLILFLANIFFIGLFMRDVIDHLPLHFDTIPYIVIHWIICLTIATLGVLYLTVKAVVQQRRGQATVSQKISMDGLREFVLARFFSFGSLVLLISSLSVIMFVI